MQAFPVELIVAAAAVFVSVALLVGLAAARVLSSQSPERRRLQEIVAPPKLARDRGPGKAAAWWRSVSEARRSGWLPKSVRDMSGIERRLANAGYRTPLAGRVVIGAMFVLPVVLGGLGLFVFGWATQNGGIAAAFGAVVGYLLPGLFLDRQVAKRRLQIRNGLPDVLDLLIVCLEAGSSLDQAVVKASDELALTYPVLAEELRVLITETRAGKPRMEAFRNLAQRTKVDDVRALVAMLVQTDRFGTSVSQALRALSQSMRTRRRQMAEEAAAKVGVKLVFPLVLFLFPAFFIVVLGPAVIRLMKALTQMGN
jgi:tight adherence protein C